MNRIKDYAGFIGWFAGLGYIALWPVTAADLSGKPFGASILCNNGALNLTDFLCKSAHPFVMPSGLHAIGCLSAVFVSARLLTHAVRRTRRAVGKGAKLVMGGKRIDRPGSYMETTILTNIKPSNPSYHEEFFGPVALFFRVKDEDEAVALANDSAFGLGGSVFTADVARGKRVASRIDTGMVFINHPTWTASDLPFGGIKNSGYGRELSSLGIQEFVNKKLVRVSSIDAPA